MAIYKMPEFVLTETAIVAVRWMKRCSKKNNALGGIEIRFADALYPIMAIAITGTRYDRDQLTPHKSFVYAYCTG